MSEQNISLRFKDGQWSLLSPLIPDANPEGRPRKTDVRNVVRRNIIYQQDRISMAVFAREVSTAFNRI